MVGGDPHSQCVNSKGQRMDMFLNSTASTIPVVAARRASKRRGVRRGSMAYDVEFVVVVGKNDKRRGDAFARKQRRAPPQGQGKRRRAQGLGWP